MNVFMLTVKYIRRKIGKSLLFLMICSFSNDHDNSKRKCFPKLNKVTKTNHLKMAVGKKK